MDFFFDRDGTTVGAGGLCSDVDDVGTISDELSGMGDSKVRIKGAVT